MSAIPYLFAPHLFDEKTEIPPTDEPNVWTKVIRRFKTSWARIDKPIVFTPGYGLEYVNNHLFDIHMPYITNEPGAPSLDWSDAK